MTELNQILVTTDFSKASEVALRHARLLAQRLGARLTLLHVWDPAERLPPATVPLTPVQRRKLSDESQAALKERLQQLASARLSSLPDVRIALVKSSDPAGAICDYALRHDISAIVIASRGQGAVARWLMGSVSERVVRHAPCPVFVIRGRRRKTRRVVTR